MIERYPPMQGPNPDEAPEATNREQQDEGQAQDVAQDARSRQPGLSDSVRGPSDPGQVLPEDTPDLVETMRSMVRSGRIDSGAFAGEPSHDDEEDTYGRPDHGDDPIDHLPELQGEASDLEEWDDDSAQGTGDGGEDRRA
jgi:hypothetical protein